MVDLRAMEPLLPDLDLLGPRASSVALAAGEVGRHVHPATLGAVAALLRTINCYYSNLIEGHDTHPVHIERAMAGDLSPVPAMRDLQLEARAHIETQCAIEARLEEEAELNPCDALFLRWVHEEFYRRLPSDLAVVRNPDGSREERVVPGQFRSYDVRIGDHVAPAAGDLDALLRRFADQYDPARFLAAGAQPVDALATLGAAHHRLLWIHPFGDGNGRVARLMTDAYLRRIGVGAHGLWTVSRGLARTRGRYKQMLANADQPRWNDLDGRGSLSLRGLNQFCEYFLDVCADQVAFMSQLLAIDGLVERFTTYCRARETGVLPGPESRSANQGSRSSRGRPRLVFRPEASRLLRTMLSQGSVRREDVEEITGLTDRTARRLVSDLTAEGFITSHTTRAPLRLRFPAHAAPYVFPGLYGATADAAG
jgi:Fic family protein